MLEKWTKKERKIKMIGIVTDSKKDIAPEEIISVAHIVDWYDVMFLGRVNKFTDQEDYIMFFHKIVDDSWKLFIYKPGTEVELFDTNRVFSTLGVVSYIRERIDDRKNLCIIKNGMLRDLDNFGHLYAKEIVDAIRALLVKNTCILDISTAKKDGETDEDNDTVGVSGDLHLRSAKEMRRVTDASKLMATEIENLARCWMSSIEKAAKEGLYTFTASVMRDWITVRTINLFREAGYDITVSPVENPLSDRQVLDVIISWELSKGNDGGTLVVVDHCLKGFGIVEADDFE